MPLFSPAWRRLPWWLPGLLVVFAAYLPLFWLLTSHPVQPWDEARTGINGLNILRNHEWLVMRDALQQPDLWNCKPPLWPWLLSLSFRLAGPTELGLRLPAALAGLATVLVVYQAGRRWLGSWEGGLLAALILLTSAGFVGYHVTRSGDFDALLTLWTTLGTLSWLRYLAEGRARHAGLTGLFFFLAAFTKGVAGLLFGPGVVLGTLALGAGARLWRPAPWLALLGLLLGLATWYGVREHAEPGYWQAVWQFELGGPASQQLEGHTTEPYYYLANLIEGRFQFWIVPAVLGGLLGWRQPAGSQGRYLARLLVCVAGSFMGILAFTQTRLPWYDAPVYPLLALLAAAGLQQLVRGWAAQHPQQLSLAWRLGALALVMCLPYWAQCRAAVHIYDARYQASALRLGPYLKQQLREAPHVQSFDYGSTGEFNDGPQFYLLATELRTGRGIAQLPPKQVATATPGHLLVVCGAKTRRVWERAWRTSVVFQADSCVTLRLEGRR